MSVNKVILVGNLGADPETRTTGSGLVIATLRIATSDRRKDDSGQWVDATEWHRVVTFGKVAENVSRYLKKGRQVYIEGKIRTRKWQDKEGQDRYTTEVVGDTVQFLGGGGRDSGSSDYGGRDSGTSDHGGSGYAPSSGGSDEGAHAGGGDDDIPF